MPRRARIDLRVRDDEKDRWAEAAQARGVELSELIRRAVPFYVGKHPARKPDAAR